MPVYLGEFTDCSKYYNCKVKALRSDEKYPTKVSIEISHKSNPKDIRSFRIDSKVNIESFISALLQAYGYFLADRGFFNDPIDGKQLPEDKLMELIRDHFAFVKKKFRTAFGDGIRKWYEEEKHINTKI